MAKTTTLPNAGPLTGAEALIASQDGQSVQVPVADITQLVVDQVSEPIATLEARTRGLVQAPVVMVGDRKMQPTVLSFDLRVREGYYLDDLSVYDPFGPAAQLAELTSDVAPLKVYGKYIRECPVIEVGEPPRLMQPLELSFDLRVLRGRYLDTGELYEAVAAGAVDLSGQLRVTQAPSALMIYRQSKLPGSVYWVGVDFRNVADPTRLSDVWRIRGCGEYVLASGAFTKVRDLTVAQSEWELAIRVDGDPEFMGGGSHGLQGQSDFYVLVDGLPMALDGETPFRCSTLEPVQASTLTRPGATAETKWTDPRGDVAEVWTRWRFSRDGLLLQHHIHWLAVLNLILSYLGMGPMVRKAGEVQLTDQAARSPKWVREDVSITGAAGTAVLSGDAVASITLNSGGSDHPGTPTILFYGGDGSGATATATMTDGVVTGVTVTNGGSGYTEAPSVVFSSFPLVQDQSDHLKLFGSEGYGAEVRILKGWDKPNRKLWVTNAPAYNKIYPDFTGAHTTAVGETMDAEIFIDIFSKN